MKLTDFMAVYGAALSTLVFVWNARRSTPQIRVRLAYAVVTTDGETKGGVGISIQNPSASTAHISGVSFVYPWRRTTLRDRIGHLIKYRRIPTRIGWCHTALSNFKVDDECPTSIDPERSHWIFVEESVIESLLSSSHARIFAIQVQDALWRNKYSKHFHYPPRKINWLHILVFSLGAFSDGITQENGGAQIVENALALLTDDELSPLDIGS